MVALYQKFNVARSTICVEGFILAPKSAHKAPFWPYAALLLVLIDRILASLSSE